jgi:hypothetical protein
MVNEEGRETMMSSCRKKWDWKALRVPLLNELKTVVCETDEPFPDVVVVTEQDYIAMTEVGVVKTLFDWCCEVFTKETDPDRAINFARWQMDKLDCNEASRLYSYIHWSLRHERKSHPFFEQWDELADQVKAYADSRLEAFRRSRKILYVCPGEANRVYCFCSDGLWRIWDAAPILKTSAMQAQIQRDPDFFKNAMTVIDGALAWDISGDRDPYLCIDVDPEEIYTHGQTMTMEDLIQTAEPEKIDYSVICEEIMGDG